MADAAPNPADEMRDAFVRLGFSNEAAQAIVTDQGINSIAELYLLTEPEAETLCKVVRKPGGLIANPVGRQAANIPNPGVPVSLVAENNLKLAIYYLGYLKKTSRTMAPADLTLDNVRSIRDLRQWQKEHKDPEAPVNLMKSKDWTKITDGIKDWLRNCKGVSGIPLEYVIRDNEAPADDPPADAGGWTTKIEEMIQRAPINTTVDDRTRRHGTFVTDNETVYNKLVELTREHECWTYVKPAQRTRDGRKAYQSLFDHYCGENNVDNLADEAESKLKTTRYYGEKRNFTFEKYVSIHVEQWTTITNLVPHGYSGIDPRSRVRYLLDGIVTKELDSVKLAIAASSTLKKDFDKCVNMFKDFIRHQKSAHRHLNVSSVQTSKGGGERGGANKRPNIPYDDFKDVQVDYRYYKSKEYAELSDKQKAKLWWMRNQGRGNRTGKKRDKKGIMLSNRSIQAVAAAVADLDLDAATGEEDNDAGSNRKNPALIRQKAKKAKKG